MGASWEESPVYKAIKANDASRLESLVGDECSAVSTDGRSYLHAAVELQCSRDVVTALLPHVPLAQRDAQARTAFHHAVANKDAKLASAMSEYVLGLVLKGDVERIQELAMAGWDAWPLRGIEEIDNDPTLTAYLTDMANKNVTASVRALHEAVLSGDGGEVLALLHTASSSDTDLAGLTALHKAVLADNQQLVMVLQQGALNIQDNMGRTALHYAAGLDNDKIYKMLRDVGEKENSTDKLGKTPLDYQQNKALLNLSGVRSLTDLMFSLPHIQGLLRKIHQAIADGNIQGVRDHLEKQRYVSLRDASGLTPVHKAVIYNRCDIVRWLTDTFPAAAAVSVRDHWGRTPLHYAASLSDKNEMMDILLTAGADPGIQDDAGKIPDNYLSSGIDLDKMRENGEFLSRLSDFQLQVSACHSAVRAGDMDSVRQLVDSEALLRARDSAVGMTVLHKAVLLKHTGIVRCLLEKFPKAVDATDHLGHTALHLAAAMGDTEMQEELKKAGADANSKDLSGHTALDYQQSPGLLQDLSSLQQRALDTGVIATLMPPPQTPPTTSHQDNTATVPHQQHTATVQQHTKTTATTQQQNTATTTAQPDTNKHAAMSSGTSPAGYPKSPEAQFLAQVLGAALTRGLAEVAEKRPTDPIEYLAHYLYSYRANCVYYDQQAAVAAQVNEEMEAFEQEQLRLARLRDEARANKERAQERERQQKENNESQIREEDERKYDADVP